MHDAAGNADLRTVTAVCTFIVVNAGKVVFNRDRPDRTLSGAFFAANAAVRAFAANGSALFRV